MPRDPRFTDVTAVLFDFDDTLVASTVADQAALSAACAVVEQAGSGAAFMAAYRDAWTSARARFAASGEWVGPRERLMGAAVKAGLDRDAAAVAADAYRDTRRLNLHPFPDAAATLAALTHGGFPVGVVTNAPGALVKDHVERLGWSRFVACVVGPEDAGAHKPDERPFRVALAALGVAPAAAVVAGDSLGVDIAPALAVGCRTVHVASPGRGGNPFDTGGGAVTPHATVTSPAGVARLLGA